MSTDFKNHSELSSKKQITGFDCSSVILKEIDIVADSLDVSRNKIIEESVFHIIHLIENLSYPPIPTFVTKLRSSSQFNLNLFNIPQKEENSKVHRIHRTAIALHPVLLKKIVRISDSIGWSRTAFIVAAMSHILALIKEDADIPSIVKLARAVIPSAKFTTHEVAQSNNQD